MECQRNQDARHPRAVSGVPVARRRLPWWPLIAAVSLGALVWAMDPAAHAQQEEAEPAAREAQADDAGQIQQAVPKEKLRIRFGRRPIGGFGRIGVQQPRDDFVGAEEEALESVFYPPDRATMQRLSKAQELLELDRYGEAARYLGSILEAPEDFFFQPDREQPIFHSLKNEAQRLIGQMSEEGRAAYELQYGAQARRMLDEAAGKGDATGLAEVSRRFFHTDAGYEATYLLATIELDRGRPLSAALCLKRLQEGSSSSKRFEPALSLKAAVCWSRAGMPENAAATLRALRHDHPGVQPVINGRPRPLFETDAQALSWLANELGQQAPPGAALGAEQWAMYRGGPARNAASLGSSPLLNRRWAVPTANDPAIEATLDKLQQAYLDQGRRALPALHPLAVNGYVFMRSVSGLEAVDFRTGKRIWNGPVDDSITELLEPASDGSRTQQMGTSLAAWLEQRVWDDATYGTLSSDGENVYCVEDLGVGMGLVNQPQIVLPNGRLIDQQTNPRGYNRLAAYEIATEGKLKWDIGSQPGDDELPLGGAFFMGPPLPLAGNLYVLAEIKNEIRLVALEARNGALLWSQQLAVLEQGMSEDPLRRVTGVSPSYSDGVLVCPTSATAVVGVDLTTRSLLWGYQYPRAFDPMYQQRIMVLRMGGMGLSDMGEVERWSDASVTIADGCVLLTPPESMNLHCLNLLDGRLRWQKPREDGLYVGCVHDGKVIVVGRRGVRAYQLSDGEPAWSDTQVALPAGSTPSGRGFFNGQRYYLPLSTAEVAALDVDTGAIVARSKSRSGTVPGNLICYHGAVISQGVDYVESFYQLEDLRRQVAEALAANPDDPDALARQGELLLDEGKMEEAIARLRRSFELAPDQRTRRLLVDALLEGLRVDFAALRPQAEAIERLAEEPDQRARFLRVFADGLRQAGETVPSFEAYLRMMHLGSQAESLERIDNALSVRRDRWVQARLAAVYESATPGDRAKIDAAVTERFESAKAADNTGALQEFVQYFSGHPLADEGRMLVARRLIESDEFLDAELALRQLEQSPQESHQRAAAAGMLQMLQAAGRLDEGDDYYRRLAGAWAEEPCLDGKTGRQILDALPAEAAGRARLDGPHEWPLGLVQSEKQKGQPIAAARNFTVELRGSPEPFFDRMTVELEQQQWMMIGRDGLGNERWRVALRDRGEPNVGFNYTISHVRAEGHLLLMSMGYQLIAIDTLHKPGTVARVLWQQDLVDSLPGVPRNVGVHGRIVQRPWGIPHVMAADAQNRPLGNGAAIARAAICFQRARTLMAVDPLSGETLWTRNDVQVGSELFGDEELIFVTPPGETEAQVLRVADGHEVGRRDVPPIEERMLTIGRRVLTWSSEGRAWSMTLSDPWQQEVVWQKSFSLGAKAWPVGNEAMGVLERDGDFLLVSLNDGEALVKEKVTAEPNLSEIYVLATPQRYLLLTNRPAANQAAVNIQAVAGSAGSPVINGMIHGFDKATGATVYSTRIDNKGLALSQPADLPILIFAENIFQQTRQGRGNAQRSNVLCLDTRSGRILYDEELSGPIHSVDVTSNPPRNEIALRTLRSSVVLKFTDEAWPIPNEADETADEGESASAHAGRAIFRGLRKWAALNGLPVGDHSVMSAAIEAGEEADIQEQQFEKIDDQEAPEIIEQIEDVHEAPREEEVGPP